MGQLDRCQLPDVQQGVQQVYNDNEGHTVTQEGQHLCFCLCGDQFIKWCLLLLLLLCLLLMMCPHRLVLDTYQYGACLVPAASCAATIQGSEINLTR